MFWQPGKWSLFRIVWRSSTSPLRVDTTSSADTSGRPPVSAGYSPGVYFKCSPSSMHEAALWPPTPGLAAAGVTAAAAGVFWSCDCGQRAHPCHVHGCWISVELSGPFWSTAGALAISPPSLGRALASLLSLACWGDASINSSLLGLRRAQPPGWELRLEQAWVYYMPVGAINDLGTV